MNILIVKLSALGDVVHTLPSLAALRTLYPEAHISWVIEEAASDLIQDHPLLDRVLLSRRKRWQAHPWAPETRREVRSFFMALRDRPYDLVIDFHGLFKSAILAYLSGGKRRLGYASLQELSGLFYTERIPEDMDKHAVDRYLDFIRYLGMEDPPVTFPIPAPPGVKERAQTLLMQVGITGDFIAINPVALWPTKLWSEEQFASLADQIMGELSIPVLFTGGKDDVPYITRILTALSHHGINLAGCTSLRELAEIYRRARLVITTDSGPMHIAAAVGTKTIALFGPTDPRRTGPYGGGHKVIRLNLDCSPCFRKTCHDRRCMAGITPQMVFIAVSSIINRSKEE